MSLLSMLFGSKYYFCNNCKEEFDEPEQAEFCHVAYTEKFKRCPNCKSLRFVVKYK